MQQGEQKGSNAEINEPKPSSGWLFHRLYQLFFGVLLFVVILNSISDTTSAVLTRRSVTIGSSLQGVVTSHAYQFDILGVPFIGSIAFEYCSNSPLPGVACVPPTGLNTSAAILTTQLGILGFTVHPNTALSQNKIIITRVAGVGVPGTVNYSFSNITNPDGSSPTIYVRISTYTSTDASGVDFDAGSVTFSIQNPLSITLIVPPYLAMCSGVTVAVDCSTTSGSTVDLGELSQTVPTTGTTQFAVATNSLNGYTASIQGSTMTAGNRIIAALPAQSPSLVGVSQFGINLRANASPSVGQNVVGVGTGVVNTQYNSPNQFRFVDGDALASSPLPTEWNRFTISYLVNVGSSQPAGRYATTMTVIATTTF